MKGSIKLHRAFMQASMVVGIWIVANEALHEVLVKIFSMLSKKELKQIFGWKI